MRLAHVPPSVPTSTMTMTDKTSQLLIATFENHRTAREGVDRLRAANVQATDIGLLLADSAEARRLLEGGPSATAKSATIGSAVGGSLFGLATVALAGPLGVLTVGPITALLGGAVTGAGVGGLLGALVGLGIPEHEAAVRVEAVQRGGVLLTCDVDEERIEELEQALRTSGARDVFRV